MRRAVALVLGLVGGGLSGCNEIRQQAPVDAAPDGPFRPIGGAVTPDAQPDQGPRADGTRPTPPDLGSREDAALTDAARLDAAPPDGQTGPPPDAALPPPAPLELRFEAIEQDSQALRITDLMFLPEPAGDFLVLDKDGFVIHMRQQGEGAVRLGEFFLPDTWTDTDAGLISVALDPDFANNRYLYLGRSTSIETNVVERYTWDPADLAATRDSARLIIEVSGRRAPRSWHNVGSIGFTPEGHLWALFGDKVLDDTAQDLASPLGALLRIIPNREPAGEGFTVPEDNPYADGSGHPAVYAKGMRSPWKGVLHEGVWYWGDVGLNRFEELNRITAPAQNFGWPFAEGPCAEDCEGLIDPWLHYGRGGHPWVREDPEASPSGKRAIWLGCVYQDDGHDRYDRRWDDVLVFGDGYPGFVRAVNLHTGESWAAGHLRMVTAMRQAPDGYVYASALGTWPVDAPEVAAPIYRVKLATE